MKKIGKNFIRYENKNGKLDNEKGPALIEYKEDGEEYSEWWRAGRLLAVFNAGVLKRTLENTYDSLKEVLLPKKYEGVETTLSCNDIEQLQIKEQNIIYSSNSTTMSNPPTISNPHKNVTDNKLAVAFHPDAIKILQKEEIPFITDNYEPKFNENLKTEKKYVNLGHAIKVEEKLPNGLRHCNDGPALTMNGEEYLEWWDKGRLVATYDKKNGELKRSIDGTFSGLKTANLKDKWKGHEVTLSLHDVSLCGFKPELVELSKLKIEKDIKIDNDDITKRIEKIRDGGFLVNEPVVKLKK